MYYRGSAAAVIVYDITKQVRPLGCFLPGLTSLFGPELELNPTTAEFNLYGVVCVDLGGGVQLP